VIALPARMNIFFCSARAGVISTTPARSRSQRSAIIRARIAFIGLTIARTVIAATTLSGPRSAGSVIAAMSGASGASRPPKRTMQRSPPSSPDAAPVHGLVIWSSIHSPAREQSGRSAKNKHGAGSESICRLSTAGLPDAVLLKWDFCFDGFRVAERPVYPAANGGGAVFVWFVAHRAFLLG
jgi:hypothetical protein